MNVEIANVVMTVGVWLTVVGLGVAALTQGSVWVPVSNRVESLLPFGFWFLILGGLMVGLACVIGPAGTFYHAYLPWNVS